jgi:hypothetical protein
MAGLPASPAGFSIKVDGVNNPIKAVGLISDKTVVELTLKNKITIGKTNIKASYTKGKVKAADGGVLASFSNVSVENKLTNTKDNRNDDTEPGTPGSLIGCWFFNEGAGSAAADSSGNNNRGTIVGAKWVKGKVGKALNFAEGNNYVEIPYKSILNPTKALTIEAWVNPTENKLWKKIISKSLNSNTDYCLFCGGKNNVAISVKIGKSAQSVYSAQDSVPIGTWSYIVGTYDGASLKLYINGKQVRSTKVTGDINAHAEPLRIGGEFLGMIDEVSIHKNALSAEKIQSCYKAAVNR